jgi:hypothetical protein
MKDAIILIFTGLAADRWLNESEAAYACLSFVLGGVDQALATIAHLVPTLA